MKRPRVLMVFASSYGQTRKIAAYIAQRLEAQGMDVHMTDAKEKKGPVGAHWDAVIIGASIIVRGHQPAVRAFIERNRRDLEQVPAAFFSVSASAGSVHAQNREAAYALRREFLEKLDWRPTLQTSFAGAVNYTQYNWLLRKFMRYASRLNGGSTDTSRDHEYTNWHEVDQFAHRCAGMVASPVYANA